MKHNFKNEKGIKYGNLTVEDYCTSDNRGNAIWKCTCICGNTVKVLGYNLRNGNTISCGCWSPPNRLIRNPLFGSKFYRAYHNMVQRCTNPKNTRFKTYGARNIKTKWSSFEKFKEDMYESFLKHEKLHGGRNTTIDRIDVDGDYCKENCRWATHKEQMNNTRANLTYKARCGKVKN